MWSLFETLKVTTEDGRSERVVKFRNNKYHAAAFCVGCLDHFSEVMSAGDAINVLEGGAAEVRSKEEWRKIGTCYSITPTTCSRSSSSVVGKKPELAVHAASWDGRLSNIYGTTGVIPVCGKHETMFAHARHCIYANKDLLAVISKGKGKGNTENIPPLPQNPVACHSRPTAATPLTPHHSFTFTAPSTPTWPGLGSPAPPPEESPAKRRKKLPHESDELPAALKTACSSSSPEGLCECDCHSVWSTQKQNEFAQDLCSLFIVCGFAFNAVSNPQTTLFFSKWLPRAKVPERRQLSGPHLEALATMATSDTRASVQGKYATGQSDGWKNIAKDPILASTMNVNKQVIFIRLLYRKLGQSLTSISFVGLPCAHPRHERAAKDRRRALRDYQVRYHVHGGDIWSEDDCMGH